MLLRIARRRSRETFEYQQVGFADSQSSRDYRLVIGHVLARRQIRCAGRNLKRRIDGIEQTSIEKRLLIKRVLAFFIKLRETARDVQIAEERGGLFYRHLWTKLLSELLEVEEVDQKLLAVEGAANRTTEQHARTVTVV